MGKMYLYLYCSSRFFFPFPGLSYEKENGGSAGPATLRARICTYVEEHLSEPLTLEDIAGFFSMNKYYISHIFKESMGISIHQYMIQKRIEAW